MAGLRVVTPSTPKQAYGLLKSAVRSDDPVVIHEHENMYQFKGEVPDEEYLHPLEGSEVVREGTDVTLFGYNLSVHWCLQAADILSEEQRIEAQVVDLYSLSPLDREGIHKAVANTHNAVIVEEAEPVCGVGAEVMAIINEEAFFELDSAPIRVSAANVPMPFARNLELAALPDAKKIVAAVMAQRAAR